MLHRCLFFVLVSFFMGPFSFAQRSYNILMDEGNSLFNQQKYDVATTKYQDAQKLKKNDFGAQFNSGNALYKAKKYDEAKLQLEGAEKKALNKAEKAALYHNLGNTYMQLNDPTKAAEFYKKSLKLEPKNEDTRKNFEIAKKKEKEKQKQNQKKRDEKGDDKKDSDPDKEDKKGDPKNNKEQGDENNPNKGNGINGKQPKFPEQNRKEDENKIPNDLKNAILEKISEREKETAKRILNKNTYSMPESREKDW